MTANSEFEFDGVVDSRHHVETTYNDIQKIEDVYGFLKGPFLESFWPNAYDPGNASHVMEGQIDKGNMLVGAVRFRQQRDMLRVCHGVQTGALLAPLRRHHQCIAASTNKGNFTTIDPGVTATAAADGIRRRRRTTSNAASTNESATAVSTTKEGASEGASVHRCRTCGGLRWRNSEVTVHQYTEKAVEATESHYGLLARHQAQRGSRIFGPGGYVIDVPPADETGALAAFEKMEVSERGRERQRERERERERERKRIHP